jgi:putative transposase
LWRVRIDDFESLSHSKWECKYHVVSIPKYRRRVRHGQQRSHLGDIFNQLARQKESRIEERHLKSDHVHMLISIPPKYAVCQVIGYVNGKSAIHLACVYGERQRNCSGRHFRARGYAVSTVGWDEATIRAHIQHQEREDEQLNQVKLWS